MAYIADFAPRRVASTPKTARGRLGLFARLGQALARARQKEMDAIAVRYLQTHGGILTDTAEREIERRLQAHTYYY